MCAHLKAPKAISELFSFLGVSQRFALFSRRDFRHFNRLQAFAVFSPGVFSVRRSPAGIRLRFAGTFATPYFAFVVPPPESAFVSPGRSRRLSLRSSFPRRNPPSFRRDVRRVLRLRRPLKKRRDGSLARRGVFKLPIFRRFANPPTRPSE